MCVFKYHAFIFLIRPPRWQRETETSPARRLAPVWRKANLRDVPPRKCCLSGQRFCSVAILFEIHWVCRQHGGDWSCGCLVWAEQKIGNNIFQTGQIQQLHIKVWNECQKALLSGGIGGWNTGNGSNKWFMICPKLKSSTFAKMAEMLDFCMGS